MWRFTILIICSTYLSSFTAEIVPTHIENSQSKCGENKTFSMCGTRETCESDSFNDYRRECEKGCFCNNGYLFESRTSSKCVKIADCPTPPKCKPFEVYEQWGIENICPGLYISRQNPSSGCHCKPGYARSTSMSSCKLQKTCFSCGQNEYYNEDGPEIQKTCENHLIYEHFNYSQSGFSGCYCQSGFVFDESTKTCVKPKNCPKEPLCWENEIYQQSGYKVDCRTLTQDVKPVVGGPGCYCKPGYIKDIVGRPPKCIPRKDCNCGPNEELSHYSCARSCPGKTKVECERKRCVCKSGYVYENPNSTHCIHEERCPALCDENQFYNLHEGSCLETCDGFHATKSETCNIKMEANKCYCKYPYVQKSPTDSTCVLRKQCRCNDNEEFLYNGIIRDCRDVLLSNNDDFGDFYASEACYCKDGLFRAINSTECVTRENCNPCAEGEEFKELTAEDTCDNWGNVKNTFIDETVTPPIKNYKQYYGCFCKYGFARNSHSKCVPFKECPKPECGENEEFKTSGEDPFCPSMQKSAATYGPKCYCKDGFVRNYKNECIEIEKCPDCIGKDPNSVFSPCVHCFDFCDGSKKCSWECLSNCDCKPGYVFGEDGKCVPVSSCSKLDP